MSRTRVLIGLAIIVLVLIGVAVYFFWPMPGVVDIN